MENIAALLLFSGVILLAATTQAITGFGFGLVSLAILGLSRDLREAVVMIAPAGLALNILLFVRLRREFSWEGLVPLFLASLVGVPIGVRLLLSLDLHGLRLMIATVMIATAAHRIWLLIRRSKDQAWHPVKAGVPCGLVSGILGGALGAGGPPVVSYLINRPINRLRYVASMQVVAGTCSCIRVVQFAQAGSYEHGGLIAIPCSLVAVFIGVRLGTRLLRSLSDQTVRNAIIGFLFIGGSYYLFRT